MAGLSEPMAANDEARLPMNQQAPVATRSSPTLLSGRRCRATKPVPMNVRPVRRSGTHLRGSSPPKATHSDHRPKATRAGRSREAPRGIGAVRR